MIDIRIGNVKHDGACNYCLRGELNKTKDGLSYPYKKVYLLYGINILSVICEKCLNKIKEMI